MRQREETVRQVAESKLAGIGGEAGLVCNDESLTLPLRGPDEISPGHSRRFSLLIAAPSACSLSPSFDLFTQPVLFLPPAFVPSLSVRRLPRCSGESCLNAQTKRRIKGTAGSARTTQERDERRERERDKKRAEGGNVYYYHRAALQHPVTSRNRD